MTLDIFDTTTPDRMALWLNLLQFGSNQASLTSGPILKSWNLCILRATQRLRSFLYGKEWCQHIAYFTTKNTQLSTFLKSTQDVLPTKKPKTEPFWIGFLQIFLYLYLTIRYTIL